MRVVMLVTIVNADYTALNEGETVAVTADQGAYLIATNQARPVAADEAATGLAEPPADDEAPARRRAPVARKGATK